MEEDAKGERGETAPASGTDIRLADEVLDTLRSYAAGGLSAERAAWAIWKSGASPVPNPRAADVIEWAKQCGFGIPCLSDAETERQLAAVRERFGV